MFTQQNLMGLKMLNYRGQFENKQHVTYCDNFLLSPALFQTMKKSVDACGTMRAKIKYLPCNRSFKHAK
jgi:hypothetical protein